MKICLHIFFLLFPILAFSFDVGPPEGREVVANNRILATVNGKNISVIDVMKKMDVHLRRAYPEYADSTETRYQFFSQNWRHTLDQMIENELILADASRLEVKISDADIRETLHERFGPNVMASLEQIGLTFDEAWQMIYSEKAVQQMVGYRIYTKALGRVGPKDIKVAYKDHLQNNPPKEEWKYQVLSIRATTEQLGSVYAQKAQALLRNEPLPFEDLAKQLQSEKKEEENITIQVSEEYTVENRNLSASHKAILLKLQPGTYSEPVLQVSRHDQTIVHRIFHLKDHLLSPPPKFDAMVDPLYDELLQKEVSKEFPPYMRKLREQFNFDQRQLDAIPSDFQPFTLRSCEKPTF